MFTACSRSKLLLPSLFEVFSDQAEGLFSLQFPSIPGNLELSLRIVDCECKFYHSF